MDELAHRLILVVEDDGLLRQDIVSDLRDAGCTVWEAATGEQALAFMPRTGELDLLITDIQLADEVTGWDIAEAFRASYPDLPVIYVSGNPPDRLRQVPQSVFLSKPYSSSQLLEAYCDLRTD